MIRERERHKLSRSVAVCPGDQLVCTVREKDGREQTFRENIGRSLVIDTIVTFDVKDEFGLEDGIGAVFGKQS
jgi:hypothetical protein